MAYEWVSFTTDYGLGDGFVAACHGVIARIAPAVRVIDVSHQVPAQQVRHGAAVLAQTVAHLPPSVHLAVVDPGVGTTRRGIVVTARDGLLVGPDNGLLLPAAEQLGGVLAVHELDTSRAASATFHGRDVFAPAAARLALGEAPAGPRIDDPVELPPPHVHEEPGLLEAEIRTVDGFGNVQLAARATELRGAVTVHCGPVSLRARTGRTFADVEPGEAVLLTDSAGYLAVAVNGGSAAEALNVGSTRLITVRSGHGTDHPAR
ncbi:SAM hydrolase/SAM-dependent halogenase family protein [Amycolatopsis suaedae]|uniref:SAM-dependent chlorinase/fluorinase n=1 Tax=Amycolatopsis suaedae TaxID=2510978 RepID=A0A4Q7JDW3_9PSEU|nr:SAM-dependent chlorinase/fluorinase [Amycolatopsis suaedae]RZQ65272.1 hypothetical protein EWH70_05145 [Amycolatopsis suaedae]